SSIHRGKFNFFPSTFFRPSRNTPTIFRLSRCIYRIQGNYYLRIYSLQHFFNLHHSHHHSHFAAAIWRLMSAILGVKYHNNG
ncbi:hypothetical protein L9F63_006778, partial [Diploptera punctata]